MLESIQRFSLVWEAEMANGKYLGLFLMALCYLWLRRGQKEWITIYALISSVFILNPVFFWFSAKLFPGLEQYGSFLWVLPIPMIIVYAAVEVYFQTKSKGIVFLAFLLIIATAGTMLPYKADLTKKKYQTDYLERALHVVEEQADEYDYKIVLLGPDDMMATARAYSGNIYPLYGKDLWMKAANAEVADDYSPEIYQLYEKMKVDYTCPNEIAIFAERYGCNVLVLREPITKEAGPSYLKWELLEEIPGYLIYRSL